MGQQSDEEAEESGTPPAGSDSDRSPWPACLILLQRHKHARLLLSAVLRLTLALTLVTSFVPDEYWQADEVAHRVVYGYGYLTWEWRASLRGYAHVLLFALPLYLLKAVGLDTPAVVAYTPRIVQAVFVVLADNAVYDVTAQWFGATSPSSLWAYLATLSSWFIAYSGQRTLSSSLEACLLPIALSFIVEKQCVFVAEKGKASIFGWVVAAFSCIIRPTSAIMWLGIYLVYLYQQVVAPTLQRQKRTAARIIMDPAVPATTLREREDTVHRGLRQRRTQGHRRRWEKDIRLPRRDQERSIAGQQGAERHGTPIEPQGDASPAKRLWRVLCASAMLVVVGLAVLGISFAIDSWFYGRPCFVQYNFLEFNVLSGQSAYYGTHPWHWYFSQGLGVVLGPWLAFLVVSFALQPLGTGPLWPLFVACVYVCSFSFLGHKEFRFITPVLYLLLPFVGYFSASVFCKRGLRAAKVAVACLVLVNVPAIYYMNRVHQGAPERLMADLRAAISSDLSGTAAGDGVWAHRFPAIMYLTDCHSTPLYSRLHANVSVVFPECPPPGFGVSERDFFHKSPRAWVEKKVAAIEQSAHAGKGDSTATTRESEGGMLPYCAASLPRYAVVYDDAPSSEVLKAWLVEHGYTSMRCYFHAHFLTSEHDGHSLCLWACKQ